MPAITPAKSRRFAATCLDVEAAVSAATSGLFSRVFVGTMLAPHDRENPELGEVGLTPEDFPDSLIFLGRQPMFCDECWVNRRIDWWWQYSGGHAEEENVQRPTLNVQRSMKE